VERVERYCCYRAATTAASGGLAFLAAVAQAYWLPAPSQSLSAFLQLWIGVALLCVVVTALEMLMRWQRCESLYRRRQTLVAVGQFIPCLVAGAMVTIVLCRHDEQSAMLLPGLWSVLFALGIFSSLRQLPAAAFCVACYYLLSGCLALVVFRNQLALSPWSMLLTFGVGQFLMALVLHQQEDERDVTA
jgi:hypothetical protein